MSMHLKQILNLIKSSLKSWVDDYAPSMGAALAYYTLFSIAPLLIIAIAVAGLVFGDEAARGEIIGQIQGLIGKEGAVAVQGLLKNANEPAKSMLALAGSVITMIIGATTVFGELQSDLDRIWRVSVPAQKGGFWHLLRTRLLSFGFVLGVGFLLLVSLVMSAAVAGLGKWVGSLFTGWEVVLHVLDVSISFAIATLLFALMYKFMPRATVAWRDVWIGAAATAFLFAIGKSLLGLYLGKAGVASAFGAAGSLVILLLWVYYGAQIFLLGAEFTWIYSNTYGSKALKEDIERDGAHDA